MPLVLGVDEAGYGPVLGPFVCVGTLWRAPAEARDADWWALLDGAVTRPGGGREHGLIVGDSKQVFDRKHGLYTLERTVLAFAEAAGLRHATVAELLAALGADVRPASRVCPWYSDTCRPLPTDPARGAYAGAAARLAATLERQQLRLDGMRAMVVTEDAFNARVQATRNKAAVVVEAVLKLIDWAGRAAGGDALAVRVDRLGGRVNYRDLLMDAFPQRALSILHADEEWSAYRLDGPGRPWEITFTVNAEQKHLPVALASMFAKYTRELLMDAFNAYWRRTLPTLKPTAGYYTDAQRFLAEIAPTLAAGQVPDRAHFVRSR